MRPGSTLAHGARRTLASPGKAPRKATLTAAWRRRPELPQGRTQRLRSWALSRVRTDLCMSFSLGLGTGAQTSGRGPPAPFALPRTPDTGRLDLKPPKGMPSPGSTDAVRPRLQCALHDSVGEAGYEAREGSELLDSVDADLLAVARETGDDCVNDHGGLDLRDVEAPGQVGIDQRGQDLEHMDALALELGPQRARERVERGLRGAVDGEPWDGGERHRGGNEHHARLRGGVEQR